MGIPRERDGCSLIIGLGNPLRCDDGLGARVIELILQRELPPRVEVQDGGTPGWGLVTSLQGWLRVILVDAAHMGLAPGTWRRFQMKDVDLEMGQGALSLHEPGLAEGLALAKALGELPEELVFYFVEPACIGEGTGLTPAVEAALPELAENILFEIGRDRNEPTENPPHR